MRDIYSSKPEENDIGSLPERKIVDTACTVNKIVTRLQLLYRTEATMITGLLNGSYISHIDGTSQQRNASTEAINVSFL
jgi:hypothetical protein